jgi:4'-phosphopantetheinyl transferase
MVEIFATRLPPISALDRATKILLQRDRPKANAIAKSTRPKDRLRSTVGQLLCRQILCLKTGQRPSDIKIANEANGKPFLVGSSSIHFSISHSGDFAVCSVSSLPTGVDIEQITPLKIADLIPLVFSKTEADFFTTLAPAQQLQFFYKIWTFKESLVKAKGVGISSDLNTINLLDDNRDAVKNAQSIHRENFIVKEYPFGNNYALAACSKEIDFAETVMLHTVGEILDRK